MGRHDRQGVDVAEDREWDFKIADVSILWVLHSFYAYLVLSLLWCGVA